jgi:hypothetical protein
VFTIKRVSARLGAHALLTIAAALLNAYVHAQVPQKADSIPSTAADTSAQASADRTENQKKDLIRRSVSDVVERFGAELNNLKYASSNMERKRSLEGIADEFLAKEQEPTFYNDIHPPEATEQPERVEPKTYMNDLFVFYSGRYQLIYDSVVISPDVYRNTEDNFDFVKAVAYRTFRGMYDSGNQDEEAEASKEYKVQGPIDFYVKVAEKGALLDQYVIYTIDKHRDNIDQFQVVEMAKEDYISVDELKKRLQKGKQALQSTLESLEKARRQVEEAEAQRRRQALASLLSEGEQLTKRIERFYATYRNEVVRELNKIDSFHAHYDSLKAKRQTEGTDHLYRMGKTGLRRHRDRSLQYKAYLEGLDFEDYGQTYQSLRTERLSFRDTVTNYAGDTSLQRDTTVVAMRDSLQETYQQMDSLLSRQDEHQQQAEALVDNMRQMRREIDHNVMENAINQGRAERWDKLINNRIRLVAKAGYRVSSFIAGVEKTNPLQPQSEDELIDAMGFAGHLGYRFGAQGAYKKEDTVVITGKGRKRGHTAGLFAYFGETNVEGVANLVNEDKLPGLPEDTLSVGNPSFQEFEAGMMFYEMFRLSGGIGMLDFATTDDDQVDYYTLTAGLSGSLYRLVEFDLNTTMFFGETVPTTNVRVTAGINLLLRYGPRHNPAKQ